MCGEKEARKNRLWFNHLNSEWVSGKSIEYSTHIDFTLIHYKQKRKRKMYEMKQYTHIHRHTMGRWWWWSWWGCCCWRLWWNCVYIVLFIYHARTRANRSMYGFFLSLLWCMLWCKQNENINNIPLPTQIQIRMIWERKISTNRMCSNQTAYETDYFLFKFSLTHTHTHDSSLL